MSPDFVTALLAGLIGGVVGPLVHWMIRLRLDTRAYRQRRIASFRKQIEAAETIGALRGSDAWTVLIDRMSKDERDRFFTPWAIVGGGVSADQLKKERLLREVAALEQEWGIA